MNGKFFVLQDEKWVAITNQMLECDIELQRLIASPPADMTEQAYKDEKELQELIGNYPDLLAGDQVSSDTPRRWLLVKREMPIPDALNGSGRWAVDHLFLDQDGVPTLVEVKLRENVLLRREMIGQMLDYATHGVAYWVVPTLQANFTKTCRDKGDEADQKLADFLGIDADAKDADGVRVEINLAVEQFWQKVGINLEAGRLRLLFVTDEFPEETLRVIEFLNDSMREIQVLAVEIKQLVSQRNSKFQIKTLVPRVIWHTEKRTSQEKVIKGGEGRKWDEASFFKDMERRRDIEAAKVARSILTWLQDENIPFKWTTGDTFGSFIPILTLKNCENRMFAVKSSGSIEFYYKSLCNPSCYLSR